MTLSELPERWGEAEPKWCRYEKGGGTDGCDRVAVALAPAEGIMEFGCYPSYGIELPPSPCELADIEFAIKAAIEARGWSRSVRARGGHVGAAVTTPTGTYGGSGKTDAEALILAYLAALDAESVKPKSAGPIPGEVNLTLEGLDARLRKIKDMQAYRAAIRDTLDSMTVDTAEIKRRVAMLERLTADVNVRLTKHEGLYINTAMEGLVDAPKPRGKRLWERKGAWPNKPKSKRRWVYHKGQQGYFSDGSQAVWYGSACPDCKQTVRPTPDLGGFECDCVEPWSARVPNGD
jgi:hypothetical protein